MSLSENSAQSWAQRSDAFRTTDVRSFEDLLQVVDGTYRAYSKLYETIGPWNAKQNGNNFPYSPPSREYLQMSLKRAPRGLSDYVYSAMLTSTVRFCEAHKGKRQLVTPHPSTHHSAHFPDQTFEIKYLKDNLPQLHKTQNVNFKAQTLAEIKLDGIPHPIYVENLKERNYKYLIVRPKLGKLGTANIQNWEVLFYTRNFGFNLEHCDSNLNPRYSGIL
jgi:hypothetical protein